MCVWTKDQVGYTKAQVRTVKISEGEVAGEQNSRRNYKRNSNDWILNNEKEK